MPNLPGLKADILRELAQNGPQRPLKLFSRVYRLTDAESLETQMDWYMRALIVLRLTGEVFRTEGGYLCLPEQMVIFIIPARYSWSF